MPGPFTVQDTLVGAIAQQIATYVKTQIPQIGNVWIETPDRPAADNNVVINLERIRVVSDTNGKMKLAINYGITHVLLRAESADSIARSYTFVMAWLQLMTAWANQTLGGLSMAVDTTDVQVIKVIQSGQVRMSVVTRVVVWTEFNIVLGP